MLLGISLTKNVCIKMNIIMNILRWIICAPISIAILGLLCSVIDWLVGWIFQFHNYSIHFGVLSEDMIFDWQYKLQDIKIFIFITFISCIGTLISAGISGYIGGKICPKNHGVATAYLFGIVILPIIILNCVSSWDTEHWISSSIWIIDMIISGIVFVACAFSANDGDI